MLVLLLASKAATTGVVGLPLRATAAGRGTAPTPALLWDPTCPPSLAPAPQVAALRGDMEGKARQLQGLQADMKALQADAESRLGACEKQLAACQDRVVALKQEAEAERQRASKASRSDCSLPAGPAPSWPSLPADASVAAC